MESCESTTPVLQRAWLMNYAVGLISQGSPLEQLVLQSSRSSSSPSQWWLSGSVIEEIDREPAAVMVGP